MPTLSTLCNNGNIRKRNSLITTDKKTPWPSSEYSPLANETFCIWLPGLLYTTFNALYFLNDGNGPNGQPYTYYVLYWKKPAEAVTTTILEVCTSTFLLNYAILLIIRRFVMCSGFFYLFKLLSFCAH